MPQSAMRPRLVALVQIGVLELHVWGSRAEHLDQPDVIVFDLDPAPDVPWSEVAERRFGRQRAAASNSDSTPSRS